MVNLSDFYDMLEVHDWYYMMSDDISVARKGERAELRLKGIAKQSKKHLELMNEFHSYIWRKSGEFRKKPLRPKSV